MTGLYFGMGTSATNLNTSSYSIPLAGSATGVGALPDIPSPQQLAPHVLSSAAPACAPVLPPCMTGPVLHTHPIALADSMAQIPPPQMLAPHVFMNSIPAPIQAAQQAPAQPMPSQQKQAQPPMPPQQPQQQPPQQQPQQPPQQPAQQPQQAAKPKGPTDEFDGALTDEMIKNLNRQMNDSDEVTRASAATDLLRILQAHPKMAEHPDYKPYVDAFIEKIMRDPSTLVRGMGEMTLQMGLVNNPSESVRTQLKTLARKEDKNLTKENDLTSSILTGLENGTLGKDVNGIGNAAKNKGANPDNGAAGQATAGQAANPGGQGGQTPGTNQNSAPGSPSPQGVPPQSGAGQNPAEAGATGAPPEPSAQAGDPMAGAMPGGGQQMANMPPQTAGAITPQPGMMQQAPAQAPSGYAGGMGAAAPRFGSRLNVLSTSVNQDAPVSAASQNGQRLNLYEGPIS